MLLACCACAFALDPSLDISQYAHTSWKTREGFTRGVIGSIAQTPDGYLWLGTELGLLRFDGIRAVPWQPPKGQQVPSDSIRKLLVDRDGTLWIGTNNGLASWKDGKLTQHPKTAGITVFHLMEDHEGTIWMAGEVIGQSPAQPRICAVARGEVQCWGGETFPKRVGVIYEDRKQTLWVAGPEDLWKWKPGAIEHFDVSKNASSLSNVTDENGTLILAVPNGLRQFVDGKVQEYPLPGIRFQFTPRDFFHASDGSLWIRTLDSGVIRLHHGRADWFSEKDGLTSNTVLSIFEDREGDIWVATSAGLDRFRDYPVPTISNKQGLADAVSYAVLAASDGGIWVASLNGVTRFKDGQATVYRKASRATQGLRSQIAQPSTNITARSISDSGLLQSTGSLFEDREGKIWVTSREGVVRWDGNRFTRVPDVPGGSVYGIVEDSRRAVWLNNEQHGLLRVPREGEVEAIPWSRLGHSDFGLSMAVDQEQGGLWLGFARGGIVDWKDGQVRASYAAKDGLGNGAVRQLRFGTRGILWAATQGGLTRIKDGHITTLTSRNGLPCDTVHWSAEDNDHDVWLYMPCGLVRIARPELDAWVADPKHYVRNTVYDVTDGVRLMVNAGGFGPNVSKAPDGRLWFANTDGVSVIDPHNLHFNKLPPPVHVQQVTADDKTYDASNGLHLPPHVHYLTIDYTALSLVSPEKVRFRYKLEGEDKDWRETANVRQVQYTNLPPKHYRFRVIASNNSGVWNEQDASLEFSIAPAYYQTNWFRALCAALVVAFLALAYWWRVRAIENRARELELQVKERTSELQERTHELQVAKEKAEDANHAKSAFLASVSHDLRTPLNGILGYVQILKKTSVTEKQQSGLDVIQQSGDHLLTLINDILELSRIEAGKLELMPAEVHVPSFLSGIADIIRIKAEQKGVEFVLAAAHNLPECVRADERRLRQVLLNLLDNAVKFTDQGKVVLQIDTLNASDSEARLRFQVSDTGVGMSAEQLGRIFQPFVQVGDIHHRAAGMGLGLAICRRLVKLMGGEIQVRSEAGKGTAFWFELNVSLTKAVARSADVELAIGYSGPRKRVLVVDDVPENRAVLIDFLGTLGFETAEAENGEEGLKRASEVCPDVVLMDGMMPVMDGLEATRRLRQTPGFEELPIIGVSASASGSDAAAHLTAGANAFLTKPIAFPRLLAEMGTLMKIEWEYESPAAEPAKTAVEEELVLPPHEELAILHELAVFGSMYEIDERAQQLADLDERYRPLANRLHKLAVGFQTKAIRVLIEELMAREHINEPASND